MPTKRKTHKHTVKHSTKHKPHGFWQMILVGSIAALVVSAGFNYFANQTGSATAYGNNVVYYLGSGGSDSSTGRSEGTAFATLDKAISVVNKVPTASGDVVLNVLGGSAAFYKMPNTLTLTRSHVTIKGEGALGSSRPVITQDTDLTNGQVPGVFRITAKNATTINHVGFVNVAISASKVNWLKLQDISVIWSDAINFEAPLIDISGVSSKLTTGNQISIIDSSVQSTASSGQIIPTLVKIYNAADVTLQNNRFSGPDNKAYFVFTSFQNTNYVSTSGNRASSSNQRYKKYVCITYCTNSNFADDEDTSGDGS